MSDDDLPPQECVYKVTVSDLGGVNFRVKTSFEETTVDDEPVEMVKIQITDVLTKSTYETTLDGDSIARMGSYLELDKFFVVTQAALDALQKGSESTTERVQFGYTDIDEDEEEGKTEVLFDRRSMKKAKRATKKKFSNLNKDPNAGNSLVCSVTYSAGLISEFFAFVLPITNEHDVSQRLLSMMQDRKVEIDEGLKERKQLKAELEASRLENKDLYKKVAALEAQMNGILEGKEAETRLQVAHFWASAATANGNYVKWDQTEFDRLGAKYIVRENANDTIKFNKDGLYRITSSAYLYGSTQNYFALYRDGTDIHRSYHGTSSGTSYGRPLILRLMEIKQNTRLRFYVTHNSGCHGGQVHNSLQIEFIQAL